MIYLYEIGNKINNEMFSMTENGSMYHSDNKFLCIFTNKVTKWKDLREQHSDKELEKYFVQWLKWKFLEDMKSIKLAFYFTGKVRSAGDYDSLYEFDSNGKVTKIKQIMNLEIVKKEIKEFALSKGWTGDIDGELFYGTQKYGPLGIIDMNRQTGSLKI